ncbi:MAG: NAD-dependent epimerase/dehydratase family protein [Planctomycetes bacterium]|jgi:UDP-glucose 4-epimerase|nr:NAD-dependent epimerase/dehydratase family protein [Planctomycetota bacterium]MBT4029670.1 NAD-dependent epimerase/dehydratase family protein [Planctomycetota bacterium]MBT4561170.1 NAD-dependent epimerase/dehydratase family protein [Planctomycetota bacterium]MBT5101795.1 NAD-dependent epimerase/dehydratase family protein [Planctomycetota bacterium]MBT5120031.1 NAD-dependent epimerase/dehydratase family protein [Planctomycetota bacterium]
MTFELVTGGAGFIGSHVVEALLTKGKQVRVVDDLSTGHLHNLSPFQEQAGDRLQFLHGSLADPAIAAEAVRGVKRVYHLAARPSVPWSFQEPELAFTANHGTTLALIEAAKNSPVERIVFSSSAAIYGDLPGLPKLETDVLAPQSPYADHKLAGEHALQDAAQAGFFSAVALRYFNVYGPRQDPSSPYSGVISLFADWVIQNKGATIYGDGLQSRDFVFAHDVAQANLAGGLASLDDSFAAVNIAGGQSISILDLWKLLNEAVGRKTPSPEHLPGREGDIRHSLASIDAAAATLDWKPRMPIADGLKLTLGL